MNSHKQDSLEKKCNTENLIHGFIMNKQKEDLNVWDLLYRQICRKCESSFYKASRHLSTHHLEILER